VRSVEIHKAEAYQPWRMGSLGNASNMLLRQFQFPTRYDADVDVLTSADHDRCLQWDYEHARAVFTKYLKTGELALPEWLKRGSTTDEMVMAFLKEILKVEQGYPDVKWTGYRITYTVNRSNGYPVFTFSLFCNRSGVPAYTDDAPVTVNVDDVLNGLEQAWSR